MRKIKYSVLTFVFGEYENVREIKEKDPDAEYILVTDDKGLLSDTWSIVYADDLNGMSIIDKCYYVRYHPFEYCASDICFRIDGSIQIKESLADIFNAFEKMNADIMVMLNPVHNYLHEDYIQWVETRNYPQENADKAMALLNNLGYDQAYKGYYQLGVLMERRNKLTTALDAITYSLLKHLGTETQIDRFDQPVWSFVLNKFFAGTLKVMPVTEYLITASKYLQWCVHNSDEAIPFKKVQKLPYLFNELVECCQFDTITPDTPEMNVVLVNRIAELRQESDTYKLQLKQKEQELDRCRDSLNAQIEKVNSELVAKNARLTVMQDGLERLQKETEESRHTIEMIRTSKNYRLGDALRHPTKWIRRKLK